MAWPHNRVRQATRHPVSRGLLALIVIGVGVWLIATSADQHTKTQAARLSASILVFPNRAENVDFKFADGSSDNEVSPGAPGFYDAVAKFGPAPARVTRNATSKSIYKVEFHGKTYTLGSPGNDVGAGIVCLVLGPLGLAYVVLKARRRRPVAPTLDGAA